GTDFTANFGTDFTANFGTDFTANFGTDFTANFGTHFGVDFTTDSGIHKFTASGVDFTTDFVIVSKTAETSRPAQDSFLELPTWDLPSPPTLSPLMPRLRLIQSSVKSIQWSPSPSPRFTAPVEPQTQSTPTIPIQRWSAPTESPSLPTRANKRPVPTVTVQPPVRTKKPTQTPVSVQPSPTTTEPVSIAPELTTIQWLDLPVEPQQPMPQMSVGKGQSTRSQTLTLLNPDSISAKSLQNVASITNPVKDRQSLYGGTGARGGRPGAYSSLLPSFTSLITSYLHMVPTVMNMNAIADKMSNYMPIGMSDSVRRFAGTVTYDMPRMSLSMPTTLALLNTALDRMRNISVGANSPLYATNSRQLINPGLTAEALKVKAALDNYNSVVTQSFPSVLRVVSDHMRNRRTDARTLTSDVQLMTTSVDNMNRAMDKLRRIVTNLNQYMDAMPTQKHSNVDNEVVQQLRQTMTKMPAIMASLPANMRTMTSVVFNMNDALLQIPIALKQSMSVMPVIGNKDPQKALERVRLKKRFEEPIADVRPEDGVVLGDSYLKQYNNTTGEKAGGFHKAAQSLVVAARQAFAAAQGGYISRDGLFTPAKPIIKAVEYTIDALQDYKVVSQLLPRAAFEPFFDLLNGLTSAKRV
ncbi:unnamed protein product, partial [Medioppia subpectinata]